MNPNEVTPVADPTLPQALARCLSRGDLTCELSDQGLGAAVAPGWPVRVGAAFAGPAHTVDAGRGDVSAVRAAASALDPGEVLVVATHDVSGAVLGEHLAGLALGRGAAGAVVDGFVRDLPLLEPLGLPLAARAVFPARGHADGTGSRQAEVSLGGVPVSPGDIVVVDGNGIVVVPAARIADLKRFLGELQP